MPWPAVFLERVTGIEPALEAWKASVLPLNHTRDWSGRQDSNLRHPAPKAGALPDCATSRRPNSLDSIPELLARARQFRSKFTKCVAAVRNGVLLLGLRFPERALKSEHLGQEQRVVAEAVFTMGLVRDAALYRAASIHFVAVRASSATSESASSSFALFAASSHGSPA